MNTPCSNPQPGQLLPKPSPCCAACAQGRPCAGTLAGPYAHEKAPVYHEKMPLMHEKAPGVLGQSPTPAVATAPAPATDFLSAHPWVPYAIVFGALAAGIGVAYAVSRPTKSVAEMMAEVAFEARRPRRRRGRR